MTEQEILAIKIEHYDFPKDFTIRDYLKTLLMTVWEEGESFSGKRPFGNSGWEYDLYAPLVKAGAVPGTLDADGDLDTVDVAEAYVVVIKLINEVFA